MPFWSSQSPEEKARRERQEETIRALADGKVPPVARERIERQQALGTNFFTSDLTAKEYLLCRQAGFRTLGQVMGTSFYNVSYFGMYQNRWKYTGEMMDITHANSEARRLAMSRMQHEAILLGASGIIGVRIHTAQREWASRLTEFTAIGTAIKIPDYPSDMPPFTSDLNGQDFWKLYQAGYRPLGIAFGFCSYYIYTDYSTQNIIGRNSWLGLNLAPNMEVPLYTQGFYAARELATERFTDDIAMIKGDGVVAVDAKYDIEDVEYEVNDYHYHDMLLNFVLMGTVISTKDEKRDKIPQPVISFNLAAGSAPSVIVDPGYGGTAAGGYEDEEDNE